MKITKRQLRRIIKEEKARLVKEAGRSGWHSVPEQSSTSPSWPKTAKEWADKLGQIIDQDLTSRGVWYEDEGQSVMTALETLRRDIKDKTSKKSYR